MNRVIAHVGYKKIIQNFSLKELKIRYNLEDLDTYGRVILKCILNKYSVRMMTGFILRP